MVPLDTFLWAFVVIFGVLLIYLVSFMVRKRNLDRDLEMFEEIEAQDPNATPVRPPQPEP